MKTFIEITKINSYGEQGKALIRVNDIVGIKQKHVDSVKLYDENGNVVSDTPSTKKDFQILVVNATSGANEKYHVDENEYTRIVSELTSEN